MKKIIKKIKDKIVFLSTSHQKKLFIIIGAILIGTIILGSVIAFKNHSLNNKIASESKKTNESETHKETTNSTTAKSVKTDLYRDMVKEELIVEAGIEELDVNSFLTEEAPDLTIGFSGQVDHVNLSVPGEYDLQIMIETEVYSTKLIVQDTIKPILVLKDLVVPLGRILEPEDFVEKAEDATELTFRFLIEPDPQNEDPQTIKIQCEDLGKNKVEAEANVKFVSLADQVIVEAGRSEPLSLSEFLHDNTDVETLKVISDLNSFRFNHVGKFEVLFEIDGEEIISYLVVMDTIAPQGTAVEKDTFVGVVPNANAFVTNIIDATDVTVTYLEKPAFNKSGRFPVKVRLTDEGGNTTDISSYVNILKDEIPPVLHGVADLTYIPGESRDLLAGVYATDNLDPNPKVTIDKSKLDTSKEGTYVVTYKATDASGNQTTKIARITIKIRKPYEPLGSTGSGNLDSLADGVLSQIINGDMDAYTKAYRIYNWINNNLSYRAQPNRTDLIGGAITGLTSRTGDCYIFRFTNQALLTRAGIGTYGMNSDSGSHSWTMVQLGRDVVSDPLWGYFDVSLSVVQERAGDLVHWADEHSEINRIENEEQEIDYIVEEKNDGILLKGERKVTQTGKKGLKLFTYSVTYRDGKEIAKELVDSKVIEKPTNEIVLVGTRVNKPPVIKITNREITLIQGENYDFAKNASATDPEDGTLIVTADISKLNINKVGSYVVTYSAKDNDGATATANITVIVKAKPEPTQTTTTPLVTTPTTTESTSEPSLEPTSEPTLEPTSEPTPEPTSEPTPEPTPEPATS